MDGDDSVTQAEVEELFAEEISSGLPAQQTGAHSNLARVDSAPFSSSSSCPSPGKADTAVLKREPLLQLLISDDSEAMPADVLPAAAAGSADPSTPTSVLQHTPAAPASMLHDSTEPNPSLTPASLPVAWQTAAPLAAAGAPQQQVLTNPLAQLAGPLARLAAARRASSGRAHTAGSGLAVPAPVQVPVGAFSNQAWAAVPATPVAVLAGGFSNLNPNLVQQLLTQQLLLAQLNAAQDSFLQMPPVTPTAAGEATHATAANPAQLGSFRRSSDNSDSPQVSRGLRRRSSSSDASQPSSSLGKPCAWHVCCWPCWCSLHCCACVSCCFRPGPEMHAAHTHTRAAARHVCRHAVAANEARAHQQAGNITEASTGSSSLASWHAGTTTSHQSGALTSSFRAGSPSTQQQRTCS
jgi:hypothetical protein